MFPSFTNPDIHILSLAPPFYIYIYILLPGHTKADLVLSVLKVVFGSFRIGHEHNLCELFQGVAAQCLFFILDRFMSQSDYFGNVIYFDSVLK